MKAFFEGGDYKSTSYETAADGFSLAKSIASNKDGSLFYVTDTIMQNIHLFKWDKDMRRLVKVPEPNVFLTTSGRVDNMKTIEGTDIVVGGSIVSFEGNIAFETQRKGETWGNVKNVPECTGAAEEFRQKEDGTMESRTQFVSGQINGWSNGAKVGKNVVGGSWIDENFLVCPYNDDLEWKPMAEPSGPGGMIFFSIVALGLDLALFCY